MTEKTDHRDSCSPHPKLVFCQNDDDVANCLLLRPALYFYGDGVVAAAVQDGVEAVGTFLSALPTYLRPHAELLAGWQ